MYHDGLLSGRFDEQNNDEPAQKPKDHSPPLTWKGFWQDLKSGWGWDDLLSVLGCLLILASPGLFALIVALLHNAFHHK